MRLHLVIWRHDFPPVRILWSTPPPPSTASLFTVGGSFPPPLPSARSSSLSTSFNTAQTSFSPRGGGSFGPGVRSSYTISQFLQDVNERIPLETQSSGSVSGQDVGHWGLEDYVVEVSGSECLHYMEVDTLLRDGDEVIIRPLESDELTARRITGRHQRAIDGSHLIDGVQFGRRYDASAIPSRPPIAIPPRKRRRIDNGIIDDDSTMSVNYGIEWPAPEQDEPLRNRFMTVNTAGQSRQNSVARPPLLDAVNLRKESNVPSLSAQVASDHAQRQSHMDGPPQQLTNVMEDGFNAPKSPASISYFSSSQKSSNRNNRENVVNAKLDDSEDESSSDESSDDDSSEISSSSASSSNNSSSSSSSSDGSSESESERESEPTSSKSKAETQPKAAPKPAKLNPPGKGSRKTRNSNERAKLRRKLSKLKELGILHKDAAFSDLREWISIHGERAIPQLSARVSEDAAVAQKERPNSETTHGKLPQGVEMDGVNATLLDEGVSTIPVQKTKARTSEKEQSDFEKKRAQLLLDLEQGGIDISSPQSAKVQMPLSKKKKRKLDLAPSRIKERMDSFAETLAEPLSETGTSDKQSKLDVAGARHLLFGSLGVRTPKTKEDEELTRNKLAAKATPQKPVPEPMPAEAPKLDTSTLKPVENWQDLLTLKATECVYDQVALSDPPFPFVQRWNSEDQKAIRACRENNDTGNRGKKRKRKSRRSVFTYDEEDEYEEHDNHDYNESTLFLDYDEPQVSNSPKAPTQGKVADNAANLSAESSEESSDDLPPLPDDLSSRPLVDEKDIGPGSIIAFKQLDMSKNTNWQPVVSNYRTAMVEEVHEDSTLRICLAKRDRTLQETENDESDDFRVYSKFEMPGYDEDIGEDDGVREVTFQDLIEPKLVRPGPSKSPASVPAAEINENPVDETPDKVPESVPVHKPPVLDTPISSRTRNDISNLIRDTVFRSTIDSDLIIPDVNPTPSTGPEEDDAETQELDAAGRSPTVGTPTFEGFDTSGFPDISISTPGDNEKRTNSPTRDSCAVTRELQTSASGNNESTNVPGQKLNREHQLSFGPSDDGLTYITDPDPTIGPFAQEENDTQEADQSNNRDNGHNEPSVNLDMPPNLSPPSFQPEQANDTSSDSPDNQQGSSQSDSDEDSYTVRRRGSNASSTVANPFYEIDQANAGAMPDSPPALEAVVSTAPARITTAKKRKRRKALSSPRKGSTPPRNPSMSPSPIPSLSFSDVPREPKAPQKPVVEKEPTPPVALSEPSSQFLEGSQLAPVDLTFSSDLESPENTDGEYTGRGLPRGPGWVQKKYPKRARAPSTRGTDTTTRRRGRGRGKRSVV